ELVEPRPVGPRQWDEEALGETERAVVAHLLEPLQRRFARIGHVARMGGRREVAEAEAGVVVARPDDPVEVDLDQAQRGTDHTVSPMPTPSRSAACESSEMPPSTCSQAP